MEHNDMYALIAPRVTATHGEVRDVAGGRCWWDETIQSWVPVHVVSDTWPVN